MDITSLAWRTDLALLALGGSEVDHRDDHVVVRTPTNPHYYWGNFLLLREPPTVHSLPAWLENFERTFPGARHRAIGVDGTTLTADDLAPLRDAGFEVSGDVAMTASSVHAPPRPNTTAEVRPLSSDDDWEQLLPLRLEQPDGQDFTRRKVAAERSLVEAGVGRWYGAFDEGRLVSSLGIVEASAGLGRFQEVVTHPDARGRGLAGTLVHTASRWALDERRLRTLVMVADPDYLAIRIYRSVGFADTETQVTATLVP